MSDQLDPASAAYAEANPPPNLIARFARHPTAAHLVMAVMLIAGLAGLWRMNTQFFPDFGIDIVTVQVTWPGAAADDVDLSVVQAIESEVRFLDEVKRVRSTAREGSGSIVVEFEQGADMQAALANVDAAVAQATTLPEDSETPEVARVVRYDTIARLALSGPYTEAALRSFAKRLRDEMIAAGIDRVTFSGMRDPEIWVEADPNRLRALDVQLADIADAIARASQDAPSGEAGGGARQIRSLGLAETPEEIARIELKSDDRGAKVRVADVAIVHAAFDEEQSTALRRGAPAVELLVLRATTADSLATAKILDDYLARVGPTLPADLRLEKYGVESNLVKERIWLLVKNGVGGLLIVVAVLFLFLNARVAFWVGMGIPASLMMALAGMWLSGQSVNMISLFGLILVLGIVVDDAIVVGEHAEALKRKGLSALEAAERGAIRMAAPVTSSTLTTVAAFLPLFVIGDIIGTIISAIPMAVCTALVASWIECFLALPGHMKVALKTSEKTRRSAIGDAFRRLGEFRDRAFLQRFEAFREGAFRNLVGKALAWRYVTVASALGAFIIAVGLIAGGRVPFNFFPSVEPDVAFANLRIAPGGGRSATEDALREVESAAYRAELALGHPDGGLIVQALATVGTTAGREAGNGSSGDEIGSIFLELIPADRRDVRTNAFLAAWEDEIGPISGLESMTLTPAQGGPPGREIDVRLSGGDPIDLKRAAAEVRGLLRSYQGVSAIEDDLPYGKVELVMELTDKGRALGFTTESVARQVRDAYAGAVAKRFARGDDEVLVRVRLEQAVLAERGVRDLYLRAPGGAETPLSEVVNFREDAGFAQIRREDGARQVAVTAEIDETRTTSNDVLAALERDGVAGIADRHGLNYRFAGKAEEQAETFKDMGVGAGIGIVLMYIILAWVFGSFSRPFAVMAIIPFGFIGAALGHWLMGFDLTILSMIALLGLAGILVNDSIVLITTIDGRIAEGEDLETAAREGAVDRLRAVVLTSLTTIGGLMPMMFETSLQARFLIPMAVTIVFGLLAATLLVLFLVPALVLVGQDIRRGVGRAFEWTRPPGAGMRYQRQQGEPAP